MRHFNGTGQRSRWQRVNYEGRKWQPLDGGDDDNNVDVYYVYDGDSNGDEDESAPADAGALGAPPLLSARHMKRLDMVSAHALSTQPVAI